MTTATSSGNRVFEIKVKENNNYNIPRNPKQNFIILIVGLTLIGSLLSLAVWIK